MSLDADITEALPTSVLDEWEKHQSRPPHYPVEVDVVEGDPDRLYDEWSHEAVKQVRCGCTFTLDFDWGHHEEES